MIIPDARTLTVNRSHKDLYAEVIKANVDKMLANLPTEIVLAHIEKKYFTKMYINHHNAELAEAIKDVMVEYLEKHHYQVYVIKDYCYLYTLKISWLYPLPESEKRIALDPATSQLIIRENSI